MHDNAAVDCLVREAAALAGPAPVSAYDDRAAWLVDLDGESLFDLEYDAVQGRMVIAGGICDVPEAARPAVYQALLQYNYIWTETGGLRMALDGMPGQAVLMHELAVQGLGPQRLCEVLGNMARVQRAWRTLLGRMEGGETASLEALPFDEDQALALITPP